MTAVSRRISSRRRLHVALVALFALVVSLVGPTSANAVPASVRSINYSVAGGNNTSGWNYGEPAPSPRALYISAETRELKLIMPFGQFDVLSCNLTDAAGNYLEGQDTYRNDELEGPLVGSLYVSPGRVTSGSGATFNVDCRDGYVDLWIARFILTERPGVGAAATYGGNQTSLVSAAVKTEFGPYIFEGCCTSGSGQTVFTGNRVRVYAPAESFSVEGRVNKATVTVTTGSRTVTALDVNVVTDGSIIGFTIPGGLTAGRAEFAIKTVSTRAGSSTIPKLDRVSYWRDYAIYDPNTDGKSLTWRPIPTITGNTTFGSLMTANSGAWEPAPVALSYQWLRDGVPIPGATASTYRTTRNDNRFAISVVVTGSKPGFRSASSTSASVQIYTPGT